MTTNKENTFDSDFEFGIDSRYQSKKERESDSVSLMQARLERMKALPKEEVLRARLMQLKLKMKRYLKNPDDDPQSHFIRSLRDYIDIIYSKRTDFAKDINITPNLLSKIINRHREPNVEFLLKLMVHSEKAYKNVGVFDEKIWYQIYYQDKLLETMSNREIWGPGIEKQVTLSESSLP